VQSGGVDALDAPHGLMHMPLAGAPITPSWLHAFRQSTCTHLA
jgi:hypothetical protein